MFSNKTVCRHPRLVANFGQIVHRYGPGGHTVCHGIFWYKVDSERYSARTEWRNAATPSHGIYFLFFCPGTKENMFSNKTVCTPPRRLFAVALRDPARAQQLTLSPAP